MIAVFRRIGQIVGRCIENGLTCAGAIWTLLEIGEHFQLKWMVPFEDIQFIIVPSLVVTAVTLILKLYHQFWFSCKINDEVDVRIRVGDILKKKDGCVLIGINDELLETPEQIGSGSLHRILMEDKNEGKRLQERFAKIRERSQDGDPEHKFPMGKFFPDVDNEPNYLFLVMSKMEKTGIEGDASQPVATAEYIQTAVRKLFRDQKKIPTLHKKKDTLYCPVLGTGVAAAVNQRAEIIRIIVKEFVTAQPLIHNRRIRHLEIVIWWKDLAKGGLLSRWSSLCNELKDICRMCPGCITTELADRG